jgi:chromosome segregation ATPase
MSNLENKEKNLNSLIEKLSNLSNSYSHVELKTEELKKERDYFLNEKNEIEKKHTELLREQKYLKEKIENLSQETEELVGEIDKWQM